MGLRLRRRSAFSGVRLGDPDSQGRSDGMWAEKVLPPGIRGLAWRVPRAGRPGEGAVKM